VAGVASPADPATAPPPAVMPTSDSSSAAVEAARTRTAGGRRRAQSRTAPVVGIVEPLLCTRVTLPMFTAPQRGAR